MRCRSPRSCRSSLFECSVRVPLTSSGGEPPPLTRKERSGRTGSPNHLHTRTHKKKRRYCTVWATEQVPLCARLTRAQQYLPSPHVLLNLTPALHLLAAERAAEASSQETSGLEGEETREGHTWVEGGAYLGWGGPGMGWGGRGIPGNIAVSNCMSKGKDEISFTRSSTLPSAALRESAEDVAAL